MRNLLLPIAIVAIAFSATAHAASVKGADVVAVPGGVAGKAPVGGSSTRVPVVHAGGVLAPLTVKECTDLGGDVNTSSVCNSGRSCKTIDQNNVGHEVCISAK